VVWVVVSVDSVTVEGGRSEGSPSPVLAKTIPPRHVYDVVGVLFGKLHICRSGMI
jgi:hypothetical protein